MKIVIASDSFKESLSSSQANKIIATAFSKYENIKIKSFSISDGGEGFVDCILENIDAKKIIVEVNDALFQKIETYYATYNNIAYIEMAKPNGLELLKNDDRNPLNTSTYGTGELIVDAINKGFKSIVIGVGGSSTNDCGIGMAAALGVKFYDDNENELLPIGKSLTKICVIDDSNLIDLSEINIIVACDVNNVLYGKTGATFVYGRQKGANDSQLQILESGVKSFAKLIDSKYGINLQEITGSGAAGGLSGMLMVIANAKLQSGATLMIKLLELENIIASVDLVITGEGSVDLQSLFGKTPIIISNIAKKHGKNCYILCGKYSNNLEEFKQNGVSAIFSITNGAKTLEDAIKDTQDDLYNSALNLANTIINLEVDNG